MSELIRVSKTTYEKLQKLKERQDLDSFDSAIRILLERMPPKKKNIEEVNALADAVNRFQKELNLEDIEIEEV